MEKVYNSTFDVSPSYEATLSEFSPSGVSITETAVSLIACAALTRKLTGSDWSGEGTWHGDQTLWVG